MEFIVVDWGDSIETVQIQFAANGNNEIYDEITETRIRYREPKQRVIVKTTSKRIIRPDGSQQIKIHYLEEKNPDLVGNQRLIMAFRSKPGSWYWGTSTIEVSKDKESCNAVWADQNPQYNGNARRCTILPQAPLEIRQRDRQGVSRVEREAAFRDWLLTMYDCCAITGEMIEEVLDAAHVIPASKNGAESPSNGFLLRTDLHRLYDARFFEIRQDGSIETSDRLSKGYKEILQGKIVSNEIVERIGKALAERARLKPVC